MAGELGPSKMEVVIPVDGGKACATVMAPAFQILVKNTEVIGYLIKNAAE